MFLLHSFGYADFPSKALAQKVVKKLNEAELFGRNLRLDIANGAPGGGGNTPRGRGKKLSLLI